MRLAATLGRPRLTHPFSLNASTVGAVCGRLFSWFTSSPVFASDFWTWIVWPSLGFCHDSCPSPATSAATLPSASSFAVMDVSPYRSCHRCGGGGGLIKRMSIVSCDKFPLCIQYRMSLTKLSLAAQSVVNDQLLLCKYSSVQDIFSLLREEEIRLLPLMLILLRHHR